MKGLMRSRRTEHEQVTLLLSSYIDGRVDAHECALVEKHVQTCAACQADLATLRATVQATRALPAVRVPRAFTLPRSMARQPRPSWTFPIFRAATAVTAALFILVAAGDWAGLGTRLLPASPPHLVQPVYVAMEQATPAPAPQLFAQTEAAPAGKAAVPLSTSESYGGEASSIPTEEPLGPAMGGEMGVGGGMGGGPDNNLPPQVPEPLAAPMAATGSQTRALAYDAPTAAANGAELVPPTVPEQAGTVQATRAVARDAAQENDAAQGNKPANIPSLTLRLAEIALAGLTLLLGAFALVASGRVQQKIR